MDGSEPGLPPNHGLKLAALPPQVRLLPVDCCPISCSSLWIVPPLRMSARVSQLLRISDHYGSVSDLHSGPTDGPLCIALPGSRKRCLAYACDPAVLLIGVRARNDGGEIAGSSLQLYSD